MNAARRLARPDRARGAAAVEFAIVCAIFLTALLGAMEMGRILFYWNTTAEATRLGARIAVVCDMNAAAIRTRMTRLLPMLANQTIDVSYRPAGCSVADCETATVAINANSPIVPTFVPFVPMRLRMPAFTTTLSRESMQSTLGGSANPMCQ